MTNIDVKRTETTLTLTINTQEDHGPSSSGKSNIVASSHGYIGLTDGLKFSLNVIRPKRKA